MSSPVILRSAPGSSKHAALTALARHRRLTATAFAAAATGFALLALRPPQPPTAEVLTAARDLPAGTVLRSPDLRTVRLPVSLVPAGIIGPRPARPVAGRMLSGPMRRGEPLTDARLLHSGMLRGYGDGVVATPIRVADAAVARLLRSGDRVDVLSVADHLDVPDGIDPAAGGVPSSDPAGPAGSAEPMGRARLLATAVPVITVPRAPGDLDAGEGAIVVLATDRHQATALTAARGLLSVTVVSGPANAPP